MNIFEGKLYNHEFVVELHKTAPRRFFSWEIRSTRDVIFDIGKFSLVYSKLNEYEGGTSRTGKSAHLITAALTVMALLGAAQAADALNICSHWFQPITGPR